MKFIRKIRTLIDWILIIIGVVSTFLFILLIFPFIAVIVAADQIPTFDKQLFLLIMILLVLGMLGMNLISVKEEKGQIELFIDWDLDVDYLQTDMKESSPERYEFD